MTNPGQKVGSHPLGEANVRLQKRIAELNAEKATLEARIEALRYVISRFGEALSQIKATIKSIEEVRHDRG